MNAAQLPANQNVEIKSQIVAIDVKDELASRACGRITMWSLQGDVTRDALAKALEAAGSAAIPPDEPSDLVALHRAVEEVARALGHLDYHRVARGEWAIVGMPHEATSPNGGKQLVYGIECRAKLVRENDTERLEIAGRGEDQIRAAFEVAKGILAPSDIGTWLCEKLSKLDAVPMRDRGGVYFVPQPLVHKWEHIIAALKACSKHHIHTIPAMRTADAIDAVLAAVTSDTQAACEKIAEEINDNKVGPRALENRRKLTAELLERVQRYEALVGRKLEDLRNVIGETEAAVATAALASIGADGE
jgi:hypothetical protein